MICTIQNQCLTVQVEDLGAQLASIRTPDGEEYLWQGNPDIWARRAPILFPFIGRLREGSYDLDGTAYAISTHGFARDMAFTVTEQGPDRVSLRLTDTPETRAVYPFAFGLTVTYALEGNRLVKSHRVENRSDRDMLYELGAHDGFRVPGPMKEWSVRLPGLEAVRLYGMDGQLMVTPPGEPVPLTEGGPAPHPGLLRPGHPDPGQPARGPGRSHRPPGPTPGGRHLPRLPLPGPVDGGQALRNGLCVHRALVLPPRRHLRGPGTGGQGGGAPAGPGGERDPLLHHRNFYHRKGVNDHET